MDFTVQKKNVIGFDVIHSALESYRALYGNVIVPRRYVVPRFDINYSESCWGVKLGSIVYGIRNKGMYAKHRGSLEHLGMIFYDNSNNSSTSETVIESAKQTKSAAEAE